MSITLLDQATINQIAAGEVVERPASVVKELVENAIDAGASAVTVEIKEGGISFIRVTDNGAGIPKEEIPIAFLRHSTSKINNAMDLLSIKSLGFRGEALSSIAAVAQVELLTKTKDCFIGSRYLIEGGEEKRLEEAGCPSGTTFLVHQLFYNTPARRKFLKSAITEAGYISELMERMALSRPDISFKFMNSGKIILYTTGSNELKDIIYHIYGRDVAASIVSAEHKEDELGISIHGYIGKPVLARGNRGQENYFINGRYIKCSVIGKAIEDAYKTYMMGHKYPFTAFHITVPPDFIDVNVHPSKMELRFSDNEAIYRIVYQTVSDALSGKNMIVPVSLTEKEDQKEKKEQIIQQYRAIVPEPFEQHRLVQNKPNTTIPFDITLHESKEKFVTAPRNESQHGLQNTSINESQNTSINASQTELRSNSTRNEDSTIDDYIQPQMQVATGDYSKVQTKTAQDSYIQSHEQSIQNDYAQSKPEQLTLPVDLLSKEGKKDFVIIGQLFATYWLIEMEQQLFIIDQHAAHEKVLYERTMKKIRERKEIVTQTLFPPIIISLTMRESVCMKQNMELFHQIGFGIEEFGGLEYKITEVPADMVSVDSSELLSEVLNMLLSEREYKNPDLLLEKVASLSCKAAVKGNHKMSEAEARTLISDMLTLENPYHCPHGRPTTISMSKYELEKKFKRIL